MKRKRELLSCVHVHDKTWNKALSRCSRAATAKKCAKKRDARAKLLFCQSKPICHLHISHNAFYLPPKFCITFVFHFSWVLQPSQEKLKTLLMQNFWGQIRWRCASGVLPFPVLVAVAVVVAWVPFCWERGEWKDEPKANPDIVTRGRVVPNNYLEGFFRSVPSSFHVHCGCGCKVNG